MIKKNIKLLLIIGIFSLVSAGCKEKKDISGHLEGIWNTEWTDDLKGDLDEMYVNETIAFIAEGNKGTRGEFRQAFEGTVEYEDFSNETKVAFSVVVAGDWKVVDKDKIELVYNLSDMHVEVGHSGLEADYTGAGLALLTGNWVGLLSSAINSNEVEKLNRDIEDQVKRQVNTYFREMFHDINKDKWAMRDVEIDGKMMTCKVNQGTFGRKATFDKLDVDINSLEQQNQRNLQTTGLPNYDWLSSQYLTPSDLAGLNKYDLRIMRNYIFARHGYIFKSEDLARYFSQYPWYSPRSHNVTYELNNFETANVEMIKRYE